MTEDERLREFLLAIHMHQGKVCPEYETCRHVACKSNHETWELVDAALQGMTLEQYRIEKNKLLSAPPAVEFRCFKCSTVGVMDGPRRDEVPKCAKCGTFDIAVFAVERTPEGHINNCALVVGEPAKDCQMCQGSCPDRARFGAYR